MANKAETGHFVGSSVSRWWYLLDELAKDEAKQYNTATRWDGVE